MSNKELLNLGKHHKAMKFMYDKHDFQRAMQDIGENVYPKHFQRFRKTTFSLLELGIGYGGSLRMWRDYFPLANIYGIDIDRETLFQEKRIRTYRGHQADCNFLYNVLGDMFEYPSIIIDDAGHIPKDTVTCFDFLWTALEPGGLYIIEDTRLGFDRLREGGVEEVLPQTLRNLSYAVMRGDAEAPTFVNFHENVVILGKK